jgi:hypothetical protein
MRASLRKNSGGIIAIGPFLASVVRFAVERDFAIHHDREVTTGFEELHYAFPRARELRPTRFCLGILFDTPKRASLEIEVHLPQTVRGCARSGVLHAVNASRTGAIHQDLAPNRDEGFFERHSEAIVNQASRNRQRARAVKLAPVAKSIAARANRKTAGKLG